MTEQERYPYFGKPPARVPKLAAEVPALKGKRVILSMPYGFVYDMRAISEIQTDGAGRQVIDIVSEEDYFRWMFTRVRGRVELYPMELVWVE